MPAKSATLKSCTNADKLNYSRDALSAYKPNELGGAVETYPDGREVCRDTSAGRTEYRRRTEAMWRRQKFRCGWCGNPLARAEATFDHTDPRGMGGARQDDRIVFLDTQGRQRWMNQAVHGWCNVEKGSRRISRTVYMELNIKVRLNDREVFMDLKAKVRLDDQRVQGLFLDDFTEQDVCDLAKASLEKTFLWVQVTGPTGKISQSAAVSQQG